jgi:hypothetical protein
MNAVVNAVIKSPNQIKLKKSIKRYFLTCRYFNPN